MHANPSSVPPTAYGRPSVRADVTTAPASSADAHVLRQVEWTDTPWVLGRPGPAPGQAGASPAGDSARTTHHPGAGEDPSPAVPQESDGDRAGYEEGLRRGLEEARAQAAELLAREREAMVGALQEQAAAARQEAEARWREQVEQQQQEAGARLAERCGRLEGLLAALQSQLQHRLAAAEDDLLALCHAAVCRMLGAEGLSVQAMRSHVQHALAQAAGDEALVVLMHPDDLALLEAAVQEGSAAGGTHGIGEPDRTHLRAVQWRASTDVALGGCVVRGASGGLDARWETQLQLLRETLLRVRAQRVSMREPAA